jgi:6-phosphogluconolactonase (cycloisomerase 2 family)
MKAFKRLGIATVAAAATLAAIGYAPAFATGTKHAVFVQTDNTKGNQVVVYDRADTGTLTQAGTYNTGGLGGVLEGSAVDHLASQGGLAFDAAHSLLYAVNAGSNTISVFGVIGDRLALHQVIASGGSFPVSIAVGDGVVYVLNALEGGSLQGFSVTAGHLVALSGSNRALGLDKTAEPQFTNTPGTVAFTPSHSQLIVTTKANGNDVDVFGVSPGGELSPAPVVNALPGTVPFAVSFDKHEHVILAEAAGFLAGFQLGAEGVINQLDAVESGQAATCWVVEARGRFYTSNAGSGSLSEFTSSAHGQLLTLVGDTPTDGGTVDATAAQNGHFLYVQTGAAGIVDEFAVEDNGALEKVGSILVPGAEGGEGIAAG